MDPSVSVATSSVDATGRTATADAYPAGPPERRSGRRVVSTYTTPVGIDGTERDPWHVPRRSER
jgi:hypothetical protein